MVKKRRKRTDGCVTVRGAPPLGGGASVRSHRSDQARACIEKMDDFASFVASVTAVKSSALPGRPAASGVTMGGGGLNILPQKSWNVWNQENIAKVRRDEAAHAADQEAVGLRQRGVDQEWRVEELRRRKQRSSGADGGEGGEGGEGAAAAPAAATKDGHVNFFEVEERQRAERGDRNEHHEKERKLQEQREARREFRCLGEEADRRGDKKPEPWYVSGSYGLPTAADAVPTAPERPAELPASSRRSRKRSSGGDDPLLDMKRLVDKKRKHTEESERSSKREKLEGLRQERVAREQAERQRALELMRSKHPEMFQRARAAESGGSRGGGGGGGGRGGGGGGRYHEDDGTTRESAEVRAHRERMVRRRGGGGGGGGSGHGHHHVSLGSSRGLPRDGSRRHGGGGGGGGSRRY